MNMLVTEEKNFYPSMHPLALGGVVKKIKKDWFL